MKVEDSDDSEPECKAQEYTETFTFAKNIRRPEEVLVGPLKNGFHPTNYLDLIADATDTECTRRDREIVVTGDSQESVADAIERFKTVQMLYKRGQRGVDIVPCIHYPTESGYYGLYFCDIERYAHKEYIDLLDDPLRPLYVLLPVFKDANTGNYRKPKDLLDVPVAAPLPSPSLAPGIPAPRQTPPAQWVQGKSPKPSRKAGNTMRESIASPVTTPNAGMSPGYGAPLWGENRGFANNYATHRSPVSPTPSISAEPSPPPEDFPSLQPSKPAAGRPSAPRIASHQKPLKHRVMRINNQKSGREDPSRKVSMLEMAKNYNLHNMQKSLTEGLAGVRGYRGEITLSAKLGKVLWNNLTPEMQKEIWAYHDIKDVIMKEHKTTPMFNNVTTASEDIITRMTDILPSPHSKSAFFEIHADARNQPALPYKPVIMHLNQGVVEVDKVISQTKQVTEIDWTSLDRKFDFQMSLTAHELQRPDVRPYTTFVKKVSICPQTRRITFENVPDFLEVRYILYKQKTKYRIHFPFVIEVTRVERVPLQPRKGHGRDPAKITGLTGTGSVWYDFKVYYTNHDEPFKSNLELGPGQLASWTVEDILGPEENPTNLVDYIKCMLILTEKCEPLLP
ncbi:hypothetical protein BCR43DRAFT_495868 [Syncephalastrum racemosum]|uniref:DUF7905 domain-containing protein n=1 Tax=Syncephalastrum racemosum TaxID=13706 RepID=A0A1X2H6N0_SYNRA|nr:hypothetical protein BCR43DRAFT_495868 [Syncephalastrum racemosum]